MKKKMGDDNKNNTELDEEIDYLNRIFNDLIIDATELSQDLINGIHLNFVIGAISIIFAAQSLWYNQDYISNGDFIPLLLAIIMILFGILIIKRGFTLQSKYSSIFRAREELKQR